MSARAALGATPRSGAPRRHAAASRQRIALTLSLARDGFGIFWLAWILSRRCASASAALTLSLFTEMTPPPQAETGGLANAIFGSLAMVTAGDPARHADRHPGRHLPGRIRPGRLARQRHALHQRHPAVGAVDRHRPLHLRRGRRPQRHLLGLRRRACARADRHPGRHPDDREHALADPERAARSRLRARHAEVARRHHGDAEGGTRRCRHRRAARVRPDRRRDCAAVVHGALEPVLDQRHDAADGEPAGDDLQVRDEPVRELAKAGLGRASS